MKTPKELEKHGHFKLAQNCGIARIQELSEDEDKEKWEYWYVVYLNVYPSCTDNTDKSVELGEVFGKGKTIEEAMESAVINFSHIIPLCIEMAYLKDLTIPELFEKIRKKEGCIPSPIQPVMKYEYLCKSGKKIKEVKGNKKLEEEYGYNTGNLHVSYWKKEKMAVPYTP